MSETQLLVGAVLIAAGFVRGAVGFGDALLAMPLLALLIPVQSAAPLVAMTGLLIAIVILFKEWRHIEFQTTLVLTTCGLLAIPVGVWILKFGNESIVKPILACVVIVYSIWSLWRPTSLELKSDKLAPVFGIAAGLLGGAYNTSGPPLVIYGTLRRWPQQQLRAMLQAYCLIGSIWIVCNHSLHGLLTLSLLKQFATAAPLIVAATSLGQFITRDLPRQKFAAWVNFSLLISGAILLLSCLNASG